MLKITVIGTGYVGLVTGACLADVGIEVSCVDIDHKKIDGLKNGILPIYEPGLKDIVLRNFEKGRLHFTTDLSEGIKGSALQPSSLWARLQERTALQTFNTCSPLQNLSANAWKITCCHHEIHGSCGHG